MHRYSADQSTWKIGNINIGGQPGEYPVVMIGTMFHSGHRLVNDPRRGTFDRDEAKNLLDAEAELSKETGLPRMTHVVGETLPGLMRYIEFVAENSQDPIVIDSSSPEVRNAAFEELKESSIVSRLIYCALSTESGPEDVDLASSAGGMVLAVHSENGRMRPQRRVEQLQLDVLPLLKEQDGQRVLIDVGVTDMASLGWSGQAIQQVKEKTGLPAGCAPMNAFHAWRRAARVRPPAADAAAGAALCLPIYVGADFLFYGPVGNAPWAYPVCAAASAVMAYAGRNVGTRPATRQHPLFRMF